MQIISSTDNKYIGKEILNLEMGIIIHLDDFEFYVQRMQVLENGNICLSNANYQLQCKE